MEQKMQQMRTEVNRLLNWKKSIQGQQIHAPLGIESTAIMQKNHLVVQPDFQVTGNNNFGLEIDNDGYIYYLPVITGFAVAA